MVLSNEFHFNPVTGKTGRCTATIKCDFDLGSEDHYPNDIEATKGFETYVTSRVNAYHESAHYYRSIINRNKRCEASLQAMYKVANQWETDPNVTTVTPEMQEHYDLLDERLEKIREFRRAERDAYYHHMLTLKAAELYLDEYELNSPLNAQQGRIGKKMNNMYPFSFNKKHIAGDTSHWDNLRIGDHLAAWGGLESEAAAKLIKDWDGFPVAKRGEDKYDQTRVTPFSHEPMTKDQYVVALHQKYNPVNSDTVYVSVDIESTSIDPTFGEIIEIGYTKFSSTGEVLDSYNELYDMESPQVRDTLGTGWVEGHHITPEMIAGKRKFTDPAVQERLGSVFNDPNVVLLAHNAGFEKTWFTEYLDGFAHVNRSQSGAAYKARIENNGEFVQQRTLDSRLTSSLLVHSTMNNTLETFSKSAGADYGVDAHRAHVDAENTFKAVIGHARALKAAPLGHRGS